MHGAIESDHRRARVQLDSTIELHAAWRPIELVEIKEYADHRVRVGRVGVQLQCVRSVRLRFRKRVVRPNPPIPKAEIELRFCQ